MISVKIKWSGSEYPLEQIPLSTTVKELKDLIKEHTGVLPVRQKLCGISLKGESMLFQPAVLNVTCVIDCS